jgi:eukaryotic-like serine/threonine-protein kinase
VSLTRGTRLGPYEILAPLGAGGMGEVYRARDTRLGRDVAVKIVPQHLSAHPEARARFEREARAVSSLNHPHICTLHDVGREGDIDYLVMELIEGETLADRLGRGPLPLPDVLKVGAQIAAALDRAHRAGVVHRDLKPGNVMLTKAGAKLMDFGLAKEAGPASSAAALTVAPTATSPLTADGAVVGTFQYMSPEALEGKETDARSDLFALGVVLYEMATARRAFEGRTQASIIAAILKEEPRPIRSTDAMSPPALDALVRLCLRKDPDERIQSAHDVRLRLEEIAAGVEGPGADPAAAGAGREAGATRTGGAARAGSRERLAWAFAALASLGAIAVTAAVGLRPAPRPPAIVSSIVSPTSTSFVPGLPAVALSPDGSHVAYIARGPAGTGLWVRALGDAKATLVAAAEDANCPFWSPDSRSISFYSNGSLRKVDVDGGDSEALAPMRECMGGSWTADGSIYYVPDRYSPILRLPARRGDPVAITIQGAGDAKRIYSAPSLLPDQRHMLYTVNEAWQGSQNTGIFVATIDGKEEKRLLPVLSNARYVEPGYLVYGKDGSLRAQRFDTRRLEIAGDPIVLVDDVQYVGYYQGHLFSITDGGLLAYVPGKGAIARQLTWVDRKGAILGTVGKPGNYFSPRISHDGRRIAYDLSEATTDTGDIWCLDLARDIATRLTFDPRNESSPNWSPDDRRILFYADFPGHADMFTIAADGAGGAEPMLSNEATNLPNDWSRDGKSILVQSNQATSMKSTDLLLYTPGEKAARPWLATPFTEKQAQFSPNGRWVAYDSDESGRSEVYVRGFAPPGGKWRVSSDGGDSAVWSRDGKELFYVSLDSRLMSVPLGPGPEFGGGTPVPLFTIPGNILHISVVTQYDVAPDGRRFLMNIDVPSEASRLVTLVTNWPTLLHQR